MALRDNPLIQALTHSNEWTNLEKEPKGIPMTFSINMSLLILALLSQ